MDTVLQYTAWQMAVTEKRPYFLTFKNTAVPADDFSMAKHGRIASVIYPPGYRFKWSGGIDLKRWKHDPLLGWVFIL